MVYRRCNTPKKLTDSTVDFAASTMTMFRLWLAHGMNSAFLLMSSNLFCTPLFFPFMLLPLSYACPLHFSTSRPNFSKCFKKTPVSPAPDVSSTGRKPTKCSSTVAPAPIWHLTKRSVTESCSMCAVHYHREVMGLFYSLYYCSHCLVNKSNQLILYRFPQIMVSNLFCLRSSDMLAHHWVKLCKQIHHT